MWQNFDQSPLTCQNWNFDEILFTKVENVWPYNLQRSYVSWQWRMIQKLKRKWLVVLKLTWATWQNLTRALESLLNLCFNWLLATKVYIVWATIYIVWVIFHDTQEICKFGRKTDLRFGGILLSKVEKVWP